MSAVHEQILQVFKNTDFAVAVLGSESQKDLDVFVLSEGANPQQLWQITQRFLPLAVDLRSRLGLDVIVRHEHRTLVPAGPRVVHLLFYPSLAHLRNWETPSFLAYVHDRGRFLSGGRDSLRQSYADYRRGILTATPDVSAYHLLRYQALVIETLVYIQLNSDIFSRSVLAENLLYALRFTLTQMLVDQCEPNGPIQFWDWVELIDYLKRRFPLQSQIVDLFEHRNTVLADASTAELVHIGLEILRLSTRGLKGLLDFSIPDISIRSGAL